MIVKTFTGGTLRDALQKVRESFGSDAVILDTQFDRTGRSRITGGAAGVSVTAACEPSGTELASQATETEGRRILHLKGDLADRVATAGSGNGSKEPVPDYATDDTIDAAIPGTEAAESVPGPAMPSDTGLVESLLRDIASEVRKQRQDDDSWTSLRRWLSTQPSLGSGVIEAFATHLVESLPPIEPFVNVRPKGQRVLFVGGRGVGKSVALFKSLAARWQSRQQKPSLRIFTMSEDHGHQRIESLSEGCGVDIAISTIADGQTESVGLRKGEDCFAEYQTGSVGVSLDKSAKAIKRALKPDIVILVLNATTTRTTWAKAHDRFAAFRPTHVLFTHWDEEQPWWEAVSFARSHALLLSYNTCGFEPFDELEAFTESSLRTGLTEDLSAALGADAIAHDRKGEQR